MADTTTLYYHNTEAVPYDSLPDTVKQIIQLTWQEYQQQQTKKQSDPGYTPFIVFMASVVVIAYVAIKKAWKAKGTSILGASTGPYESDFKSYDSEIRKNELLKEYNVYRGVDLVFPDEQYEKILGKYSPYYRRLSPDLKEKFLQRTKKFLGEKTFLIKTDEPFVEMPALISAAAVQLTFGLDKYLLPHYQYIRVFKEEYFASDNSLRVLAGHVYGNTITLAWNHFLEGMQEYTDGVNLGLHEMAHALYFQLVEADFGRCSEFTSSFNKVIAEGREVHEEKNTRPSGLFKENAYRNLQEFWAESVELFFERPAELKRENSELYDIMKEILNQDPVNQLYPIND